MFPLTGRAIGWGYTKQSFLSVLALTLILGSLSGCTPRRGYFTIGAPSVIDAETSRATLAAEGLSVEAKLTAVDAATLNQINAAQELISRQLGITVENLPLATDASGNSIADTTAPDAPTASTSHPELPGALDLSKHTIDSLFGEQLDDEIAKQSHLQGVKLLYSGDARLKNKNSRLYLVRFDLWVEPHRQSYWSYLWRWMDLSNGFQNYTKNYHAEINFVLPRTVHVSGSDPLISVYAVQPVNESLTALDSLAALQNSQISILLKEAAAAAKLDFINSFRQQFQEQRKAPIVRGIIKSPREFQFILSPRQRLVRKGWRLPFTSRYKVSKLLEPHVRPVYVYLLVDDVRRINHPLAKFSESNSAHPLMTPESDLDVLRKDTLLNSHLVRDPSKLVDLEVSAKDVSDESGSFLGGAGITNLPLARVGANGALEVPLTVYSRYKEFGDPDKNLLLPFGNEYYPSAKYYDSIDDATSLSCESKINSREDREPRLVTVQLPLNLAPHKKRFRSTSPTAKFVPPGEILFSWGDVPLPPPDRRSWTFTLEQVGTEKSKGKERKCCRELRDNRGILGPGLSNRELRLDLFTLARNAGITLENKAHYRLVVEYRQCPKKFPGTTNAFEFRTGNQPGTPQEISATPGKVLELTIAKPEAAISILRALEVQLGNSTARILKQKSDPKTGNLSLTVLVPETMKSKEVNLVVKAVLKVSSTKEKEDIVIDPRKIVLNTDVIIKTVGNVKADQPKGAPTAR